MYQATIRSDELYHYGIMGMKWGVRRYQNPDGSLTDAGRRRYGYGVANSGSMSMPAMRNDMRRAAEKAGNRHASAGGSGGGGRASGGSKPVKWVNKNKKYAVASANDPYAGRAEAIRAYNRHAYDLTKHGGKVPDYDEGDSIGDLSGVSDETLAKVIRTINRNKRYATTATGGMDMSNLSNDDLSQAVKRYELEKKYKKINAANDPEQQKIKKLQTSQQLAQQGSQAMYEGARAVDTISRNKANNNSSPKKDLSKMTDRELQQEVQRMNLERQYNQLTADPVKVSKGEQYAHEVLEYGGLVLGTVSSALSIALLIKQLKDG